MVLTAPVVVLRTVMMLGLLLEARERVEDVDAGMVEGVSGRDEDGEGCERKGEVLLTLRTPLEMTLRDVGLTPMVTVVVVVVDWIVVDDTPDVE